MIRAIDCEYRGLCPRTGKYIVHEQLYPDNRGFIVHAFDREEEALEWLRALAAGEKHKHSFPAS